VLGRNEAFDVALLRTRGTLRLPPLAFGSSRALAPGDFVVSVGTAPEPIAVGVVSVLGRRVEAQPESQAIDFFGRLFTDGTGPRRAYAEVIQHDSPIEPHELGAPLVEKNGRLVGINVATVYRGSAFAAPIDRIASFLEDLKAGNPGPALPKPGFIGVQLGPISPANRAGLPFVDGPGAEIAVVLPGRSADRAGIRAGDVVLAIDGTPIDSMEGLVRLVRQTEPGRTLIFRLFRSGKTLEIPVVVGERGPND